MTRVILLFVAIFLSSAAGAHRGDTEILYRIADNSLGSPARLVDTSIGNGPFTQKEPVPFARLDISRALNPWHDLMMTKLEILAYNTKDMLDEHENKHRQELRQARELNKGLIYNPVAVVLLVTGTFFAIWGLLFLRQSKWKDV